MSLTILQLDRELETSILTLYNPSYFPPEEKFIFYNGKPICEFWTSFFQLFLIIFHPPTVL
jgi:hypothetical protein